MAWAGLCEAVEANDVVYLADGAVRLRVKKIRGQEVETRVEVGGGVTSRQGLNVPGELKALPAVAEDDLERLRFGDTIGVDLVALSFVRRPDEITDLREHTGTPIVAKIEKPQAVENLDAIAHAADCLMVARGDLGIEMEIERVPLVQKDIIRKAGELARPVITATQMLDSMVVSSRPTRAEVADVANAIMDGTDAVMLSQETAVGAHPVEAVKMMDRDRPHHRERAAAGALEPPPGAARGPGRARPRLHRGLQRLRRRDAAGPGRAGGAHAVGAVGADHLRAPPARSHLRAVTRPRGGAPCLAHVGRDGLPR